MGTDILNGILGMPGACNRFLWGMNSPNPQQMQAMTPEQILEHQLKLAGLFENMVIKPEPLWNGKLWYPLGVTK